MREELQCPRITWNGKIVGYGGNQEWFSGEFQRLAGCGSVTGSNLAAIYAASDENMKPLYDPKTDPYCKEEYLKLMETMYAYMKPGFMGIKEPGPWCPKAPAPFKDSVVVMPGIAFDRNGTRAGYGGGYYDTYLEGHAECIKAALAYSVQIAPEIPAAPADIKVDMIVTEKELIICSQNFREIR